MNEQASMFNPDDVPQVAKSAAIDVTAAVPSDAGAEPTAEASVATTPLESAVVPKKRLGRPPKAKVDAARTTRSRTASNDPSLDKDGPPAEAMRAHMNSVMQVCILGVLAVNGKMNELEFRAIVDPYYGESGADLMLMLCSTTLGMQGITFKPVKVAVDGAEKPMLEYSLTEQGRARLEASGFVPGAVAKWLRTALEKLPEATEAVLL